MSLSYKNKSSKANVIAICLKTSYIKFILYIYISKFF